MQESGLMIVRNLQFAIYNLKPIYTYIYMIKVYQSTIKISRFYVTLCLMTVDYFSCVIFTLQLHKTLFTLFTLQDTNI